MQLLYYFWSNDTKYYRNLINIQMIKKLLISTLGICAATVMFAQTKVVTASGKFSPANVTINQGENVEFTTESFHDAVEVFDANSTTSNGGFSIGKGETKAVTFNKPGTYYYYCTVHPSMRGTITVNSVNGIEKNNIISEISVFPNPTHGDAKLEFSVVKAGKVEINLLNVIGKKIENVSSTEDLPVGKFVKSLNISDLPQGIYFVEIVSNGTKTVQRLLVLAN